MACIAKRRGRYVIDCYDQNGKRYRKTMKAGSTKDEARKELREIEAKIERRTFLHEKKAPLFSAVKTEWLKYKKQFLRETTYETCETNLRNHFDSLNGLRINQITMATIEKFIAELQNKVLSTKATRKPGYIPTGKEKKISLNTMRKIIVTLNQVMAYAVRHRLIDYNPVRDAERPRNQGKEVQEKAISILTPKQIRNFLEAVTDEKYHTLFLTAIMTGARQGEILGLKWSDVDFSKKQISINRTFNMGRFFTPKTKGSIRQIDLAPMVVRALAAWKLLSAIKEKEKREEKQRENGIEENAAEHRDLVFPNEAGGPMNYSNMVQRHFRKALKDAGIPQIRFHDLRHTYASLLLAQGENVKYVQTQLGHSSPTVTLNVYAHLMKKENQEAACRLENTIFQATGHNLVTNEEKGLTING
ncbi:MAG TPA: tyrosine-type recombinase/integrase [Smithellaceae bacterium]|mgnify:FL=1|nr:tyrosine-type recombinase/integrase [Smithellaceae bacterium]